MSETEENSLFSGQYSRRQFIKVAVSGVVASSFGMSIASASQDKAAGEASVDYHICKGLNIKPLGGKGPGEADATNLPPELQHSCAGGNTCKGLGGCGTGDYARQYYVGANECGRSDPSPTGQWDGTGGCGVPLGTGNTGYICTQLNNAVPTPEENPKNLAAALVGVPVWAIARARFEEKMVKSGKTFGKPTEGCGIYEGNVWDGKSKYSRGNLPDPFPQPKPSPLTPPKKKKS